MELLQKFSNSKEVIVFFVEIFFNCFILEGEVKFFKIGIFQDFVECFVEEECVSKMLLCLSLCYYINSWCYLYSIKKGNFCVDFDGNQDVVIEEEYEEYVKK